MPDIELSAKAQRALRQIRALRSLPYTEVGERAEQRVINNLNITDTLHVAEILAEDEAANDD